MAGGIGEGVPHDFGAGDPLNEFDWDPVVPLRMPTASTLAGLVGWDKDLIKGSVGGALEARGGIFMLPLPFN